MSVKIPGRLILVLRDKDNQIIDCFPGPLSYRKLEAITIAYTLLNTKRMGLERVEIHPYEHAISHYTQKPLIVIARDDLAIEE